MSVHKSLFIDMWSVDVDKYNAHLTARSESMSRGQATSTFNKWVFTHCTTALTHWQTVALLTLCMSATGWYCAPLPSQWSVTANCCFTDSNAEQRASRQPSKTFLWTRKRTQTQRLLVVCILFFGAPPTSQPSSLGDVNSMSNSPKVMSCGHSFDFNGAVMESWERF